MSSFGRLHFRTTNCIVTGEPARIWCGHVVAETFHPGSSVCGPGCRGRTLAIGAGFSSNEAVMQSAVNGYGCYGPWERAFGLQAVLVGLDEVLEGELLGFNHQSQEGR